MEAVADERPVGGRPVPEVVIDAVGDRFGLAVADVRRPPVIQARAKATLPSSPAVTYSPAAMMLGWLRRWVPICTTRLYFRAASTIRRPSTTLWQRLLAVDVLARLAAHDGRQGVPVVGRGDDHAVDRRVVEHLAHILLGLRRRCLALRQFQHVRVQPFIGIDDVSDLDVRLFEGERGEAACRGCGSP